ncbi:hypothetical protein JTF12_21385 [Leclercia adecarboxylata]|nr:hypothetical protein [Leclercia adecarboxylata]URM25395.1 hypothetical protein JJN11_23750 [Leclercia adecarboxylata]
MGITYFNDQGVRQNKSTSKEWFGRA